MKTEVELVMMLRVVLRHLDNHVSDGAHFSHFSKAAEDQPLAPLPGFKKYL
jgi:hypothetical protein